MSLQSKAPLNTTCPLGKNFDSVTSPLCPSKFLYNSVTIRGGGGKERKEEKRGNERKGEEKRGKKKARNAESAEKRKIGKRRGRREGSGQGESNYHNRCILYISHS